MFGFGKKVELEVPDGKGGIKKVKISQKELDRLVAEEKLTRVDITVHILDPMRGYQTNQWAVGTDIPADVYNRLKEPDGSLYAIVAYKAGQPEIAVIPKARWDEAKRAFGAIDAGAERAAAQTLDELRKR